MTSSFSKGLVRKSFAPLASARRRVCGRHVGRQHEDGQVAARRLGGAEALHDGETVDVRHGQVEQDEVGADLPREVQGLARVGRAVRP